MSVKDAKKHIGTLFVGIARRRIVTLGIVKFASNVKIGDHWYHCNDAFVCHAGEGHGEKEVLLAEGAYMLFYLRKDGK